MHFSRVKDESDECFSMLSNLQVELIYELRSKCLHQKEKLPVDILVTPWKRLFLFSVFVLSVFVCVHLRRGSVWVGVGSTRGRA